MFKAMSISLAVLISVLLATATAVRQNPLKNPKICGRPQCELATNKFKFLDKIYTYDYTTEVRSEFAGTGQNSSYLLLTSKLEIVFPKPCEGFLRITEARLRDTDRALETKTTDTDEDSEVLNDKYTDDYYGEFGNDKETSTEEEDLSQFHAKTAQLQKLLKKNMLRFAFHDGLISEVCTEANEPNWILNIKRGMLSMFQNTMDRFDIDLSTEESDISGLCDVTYALEGAEGRNVKINKTKNIASCRYRYATNSLLQTIPYTFRNDKMVWPILNSESHCQMIIDVSVYREVSCMERHQIVPFSNGSTGAVTTLQTKLTLIEDEVKTYNRQDFLEQYDKPIEKRTTLLFDSTPAIKPTHSDIKITESLIRNMCAKGFPTIQREFIDIYTSFLLVAKNLDYESLKKLLEEASSICDTGSVHVLESLPYLGSTASYQLMRDQIIEQSIPKAVANDWMTSLAFIQRPDEQTLETLYTIMEFARNNLEQEYTLGAAAVVHSYCRHNEACEDNETVLRIVNSLEKEFLNLYNMYKGNRRTRERMIIILKALGNIGIITKDFAEHLQGIIVSEDVTLVKIRLQAAMAFRRVDCQKYRHFFLKTYSNRKLNSEVRIVSFLQIMRCPDYLIVETIKDILEEEEVNQVGSYVWSYLKNLAASNSPLKIEIQSLFFKEDLNNKFKLDFRKYSRNYEHSLFFDEYNFGSTTDMNIIFGTESYLPRTASVNFTTHLFGQSVNLFELNLRAEGFENLVTSIFGPNGPLNTKNFRKKLGFLNRWLGSENFEETEPLENWLTLDALRQKRDTENDSHGESREKRSSKEQRKTQIQHAVDEFKYKLKYDYNNPIVDFGARVFGNDLHHYSLEGMAEVMGFAKEFDPFYQMSKILSGHDVTYTKSRVFLDASYNVPLSNGFPLAITVFGASSVDLRLSGNLNRLKSPDSEWYFDLEARLKPSISLDVLTTMQTDFYYSSTGIKVKSNLYSNSEVQGKLKVRGENEVAFSFSLPQDKSEIFSARSELLVVNQDEDIQQTGIVKRSSNSTCTWPMLDEAMGFNVCAFYSVPDLSSPDVVYPSLLFAGPLNFTIVLAKSDLSAKEFVFRYLWERNESNSHWSLVFHTPNTVIKRELIANVTAAQQLWNASLSFERGKSSVAAGLRYDGNPSFRRLDTYLFTNGNKSLDMSMELQRWQGDSLTVYKPKVLLTINGINVTGLVGVVKRYDKFDIVQNDFDLSFETRKLQALVRGKYVQTEVTTHTNISIEYRFQANRVETINFAGKLVNHGDMSKTEYRGDMQLHNSAYEKFNFHTNGTWLSMQGHTEGVLAYNHGVTLNNPRFTNVMRVVLVHSDTEGSIWDGPKTWGSFEILLPKSNIDFGVSAKHERRFKNGTEHNVIFDLRYATGREATAVFSVHFPQKALFALDAFMNITFPDFNSTTAFLKINERQAKNYMINFDGKWFTGHSIAIKSNYKDHSSRVQGLHHIKMVVESPSFKVTTLNVIYRRNQFLIFADVKAKYDTDPYALTVNYVTNPVNKSTDSSLLVKILDKEYSITGKLLSNQPKLLQIEIHMDKVRDVEIKISMLTLDKRKEVSLEFQWDANRDPSKRLGLLLEYNNPAYRKYYGNMMFTYPDRTISCGFDAYTGGPHFDGNARVSWNVGEDIVFSYNAGFLPNGMIDNWFHAELSTPFDGWQRNHLKMGIYNYNNLLLANSSLLWANSQNFLISYESDYYLMEPITSFLIRFGLNSTVQDIPTLGIYAKHWQDWKKFNTELELQYRGINETLNRFAVKSNWEMINTKSYQNISGTMFVMSPFEKYKKGALAAKFGVNEDREMTGAAALNFDLREFTFSMKGYVKKFTDNMLTVNITTPLDKFRTINGRLGLSEVKRHAVAEISASQAVLGAEVLLDIVSFSNFDIILSVATPIENMTRAAIIAKSKRDTIDLRGLWNEAQLGFTGVWYMKNKTDFEYSYRVFTPLRGFEDNGFVAKLKYDYNFVLELFGKLASKELGIRVQGRKNSKMLTQLGGNKMELEFLYDTDFPKQITDYEDYSEDNMEYDDLLSYNVDFQLYTLKWPKVEGYVDIQETNDYYIAFASIKLPQGVVEIRNRLYYPDYINVLNVMNINTPFNSTNHVKVKLEYHVDLNFNKIFDSIYISVIDNVGEMKELGVTLNYTKTEDLLKPKTYNIDLNIKTPLESMKNLDINGLLETDENLYRGNISGKTENTYVSAAASVESDENYLETTGGIILDSSLVPYYALKTHFKNEHSTILNNVELQIDVNDNHDLRNIDFITSWQKDLTGSTQLNSKLETSFLNLRKAELYANLMSSLSDNSLEINADLITHSIADKSNQIKTENYGIRLNKQQEVFNVELWSPVQHYRNISMHGSITSKTKNSEKLEIKGQLYLNSKTHQLEGLIYTNNGLNILLHVDRTIKINLVLLAAEYANKGQSFSFIAQRDYEKYLHLTANYNINDDKGLEYMFNLNSTEVDNLSAQGQVQLKTTESELGFMTLEVTQGSLFGLTAVKVRGNTSMNLNYGRLETDVMLNDCKLHHLHAWTLVPSENYQLLLERSWSATNFNSRSSHFSIAYLNPHKNYQNIFAGTKLNVDKIWNAEVNSTLNLMSYDDVKFNMITSLPKTVGDVHTVAADYHGNLISQQFKNPNFFFEGKYLSEEAEQKVLTRISYYNATDTEGLGRVEWGSVQNISEVEASFKVLRKTAARREFSGKLLTPKFENEDTLVFDGYYDLTEKEYHLLKCDLNYPASNRITETDFAFFSLSNMHGFVNSTTPFKNLTWLRADVDFISNDTNNYSYMKGTWPRDFAYFKMDHNYKYADLKSMRDGNIEIQVPFANRHTANVTYSLTESYKLDTGKVAAIYNERQVLNGTYDASRTERDGLIVETTKIALENELKPLGVHYSYTMDVNEKFEYPVVRHLEIFELNKREQVNLTGEVHLKTTSKGQQMKLVAIHPNRTVVLTTDYEEDLGKSFSQKSKLELSPTVWVGYKIQLTNKTQSYKQSQHFNLELFYPNRNLSTEGWYYHNKEEFNSNVMLRWKLDGEKSLEKQLTAGFLWEGVRLRDGDLDHQQAMFTLKHPQLVKDIEIKSFYYRGLEDLFRTNLSIDYSNDPNHLIQMNAVIRNATSQFGEAIYGFEFNAEHKASELYCTFNASSTAKPLYYKFNSHSIYKREYFADKISKFITLLDLNKKEVEYLSQSPYRSVRFWAIPKFSYPIYGFNATLWDSEDTNNTGYVFVDLHNKIARMDFNMTEDASQNLQMYGYIPDTQSAFLDVWRNYDEIRIIDVTSYVKMNHSRLITGRFHWRPKIKQEIKEKILAMGSSFNHSITEGVDFWVTSLYSETMDAMEILWTTTRKYNERFFEDMEELKVLEEDMVILRNFVNSSYEADEFYIKTVVNFSLTVLDELAIRDHIASLPVIFTEMWQAMGDTGKALRQSIVWLINTAKKSYNRAMEVISRFFNGEALQYVSNFIQKAVGKYDRFIKDLHIKFIKYMEALNKHVWKMLEDYWKYILKRIEPHVFKFLSMIESTAWELSKELFDFINNRSNELAQSPYFGKVSSFTQDLDRLYKDFKSNDDVTNIAKYSKIVWNFIKEKYVKLVPFGHEVNEVFTEIWEEVKELQKIDQVAMVVQKYNEVISSLEWISEELQLDRRLQQVYKLLINKLSSYTMNALETSDKYREAKTLFYYEPKLGVIDLEQKLPMSWHAFSETPKFEEIPEYRFLLKTQNLFTNSSLIHFIYNLRYSLDPQTWLPPYASRALLIDSRHFMTFDENYVHLNMANLKECGHLLAYDFVEKNFTLLLEHNSQTKQILNKLTFMAGGELLELDLQEDRLFINGKPESMLPLLVHDLEIYRELDILTLRSKQGYSLVCNLQFHLCTFELSGWYFGRSAGLLGTMNNEKYDDYLTPKHEISLFNDNFTNSWALHNCHQQAPVAQLLAATTEHIELCEQFFKSGMFSTCGATVNPAPFFDICLELSVSGTKNQLKYPVNKGACTAALAYIEACQTLKIPLRVPSQCTYCQIANGSYVSEGTIFDLQATDVPHSSDVVFIVEAKPCNTNFTVQKSIMAVATAIENEFKANQINNNRYAVVAFGGFSPFDDAHTVLTNSQVFTDNVQNLKQYFHHIKMNNGTNKDVLQAISHASRLPFRTGVSKNFILLLCSTCHSSDMRFDYSSIVQYMRDESVNLHVLADTEFDFENTRKLRHFFGLDRDYVYSKRYPEGDENTRQQLHLKKSALGICMPLALETDGSVFSVRKFMPEHKYPIKRLAGIFAKRVVKTGRPHMNQTCECSAHNTGVAYMVCSPRENGDEISDVDYDTQFNEWDWEEEDEIDS